MHVFETTDSKTARRFRMKQFNGGSVTFSQGGTAMTGFVHAVLQHKSIVPARWTIAIVPKTPAVRASALRTAPRAAGASMAHHH
jgi:hypothetical protein